MSSSAPSSSASNPPRRPQRRRQQTCEQLLASATRRFGEHGYAATSLDDIAADCGLTIGAIYHHFGNKKQLFAAVNALSEQRILHRIEQAEGRNALELMRNRWQGFLALCAEPGFRQIVLVDSLTVLGRDRWATSAVSRQAASLLGHSDRPDRNMAYRILRGAMAEAALAIAEAADPGHSQQIVDRLIGQLLDTMTAYFDPQEAALGVEAPPAAPAGHPVPSATFNHHDMEK